MTAQYSARAGARRAVIAAGALALAASLVACAGEPEPTPTPTPDANAPVFKTDEEAFAAAADAYQRYLEVELQVTRVGGEGAEVLSDVAQGQALEYAQEGANGYLERRRHTVGDINVTFEHTQFFEDSERGAVVQMQACEDISALDVLDASGKSVVRPGRVVRVPYGAVLEGPDADGMKVSERWLGRGTC